MVSTQPFFQSSAMKIHDLTTKMMAKMPRITRNCESWARLPSQWNRHMTHIRVPALSAVDVYHHFAPFTAADRARE